MSQDSLSKCNFCNLEIKLSELDAHVKREHIHDIRLLLNGQLVEALVHNDVFYDTDDWDEKGYVTKMNELNSSVSVLLNKSELPVEVLMYFIHSLKVEYAHKVSLNQNPTVKIALPNKGDE